MSDEEVEEVVVEEQQGPKESWMPSEPVFYGTHTRTIAMLGEITPESSLGLISQLFQLDVQDSESPIILHINSGGGHAIDGLVIYDVLRSIEAPVFGLVVGSCMSAAMVVLAGCDFRIATPHSLLFYHQAVVDGVSFSSGQEVSSMAGFYSQIQDNYDNVLRKRAGISKRQWDKEFKGHTSKYLTAAQARDLGFIDELLDYSPKLPIRPGDSK